MLDELLSVAQYTHPQAEKEKLLLPELITLTQHHIKHCPAYAKIVHLTAPDFEKAKRIEDLPYLPVGLFKSHTLQSIPDAAARITMTSSGTTGQVVSRIILDDGTARNQARAFAASLREALGPKRLPLLFIESEATIKSRETINARVSGVLGMLPFSSTHSFALDADMNLNIKTVKDFLQQYGNAPFLMFGFTFMVWKYFHQAIASLGLDFSQGTLIHGGGWKKMAQEHVDNQVFRTALKESANITRIYNYYGMVEQTGTAYLEGDDGNLYPPAFGDVIIRNPHTWQPLPHGQEGIIQVLSLIPHSYPGHSLMTEDMGVIKSIDAGIGGRMGKALHITGRAPKAVLRGCSDVYAKEASA